MNISNRIGLSKTFSINESIQRPNISNSRILNIDIHNISNSDPNIESKIYSKIPTVTHKSIDPYKILPHVTKNSYHNEERKEMVQTIKKNQSQSPQSHRWEHVDSFQTLKDSNEKNDSLENIHAKPKQSQTIQNYGYSNDIARNSYSGQELSRVGYVTSISPDNSSKDLVDSKNRDNHTLTSTFSDIIGNLKIDSRGICN